MEARKNETTATINRELMDVLIPPNVDILEWNDFIKEYNYASKLGDLDHPVQLNFQLNSGCNMKCPFCIHGHEKIRNKNMCFNMYKNIIDEAVKIGVKSLKISNINEPLMRIDLGKFIEYAKQKGIVNIYMATNGLMLTKKRSLSLINSGIDKIFISIDANTAETYNKQRFNGYFEQIKKNVLDLVDMRNEIKKTFPLIRVSFLENKINTHEKEDFIEYWTGKVDMIGIQKMYEVPNKQTGIRLEKSTIKDFKCSMPFKLLSIDQDGNIFPCCTMYSKEMPLGNIKDMTLEQAWNSDQMNNLRDIHKKGKYINNPICRKCVENM